MVGAILSPVGLSHSWRQGPHSARSRWLQLLAQISCAQPGPEGGLSSDLANCGSMKAGSTETGFGWDVAFMKGLAPLPSPAAICAMVRPEPTARSSSDGPPSSSSTAPASQCLISSPVPEHHRAAAIFARGDHAAIARTVGVPQSTVNRVLGAPRQSKR